MSHPSLSQIEQECEVSLIKRKIYIQQERETGRQAGRQAGRQTEKQTDLAFNILNNKHAEHGFLQDNLQEILIVSKKIIKDHLISSKVLPQTVQITARMLKYHSHIRK